MKKRNAKLLVMLWALLLLSLAADPALLLRLGPGGGVIDVPGWWLPE